MMTGMAVKAGDMRLTGLQNKIVIIDEFHAYDAYMMDIIEIVLKWLRAMQVPVIILSATLQHKTLQQICKIYGQSLSSKASGYPVITVTGKSGVKQYSCAPTFVKKYPMVLCSHEQTVDQAVASAMNGGNTLFIANSSHFYAAAHSVSTVRRTLPAIVRVPSIHTMSLLCMVMLTSGCTTGRLPRCSPSIMQS